MKYTIPALSLILTLLSTNTYADSPWGVQIFGEVGAGETQVTGANLLFRGHGGYGSEFAYVGLGFANVSGVSHEKDDTYGQLVMGLSMPWRLSPYVEVGLDPIEILAESFSDSEHSRGLDGFFGIGARFAINRHISLDLGYKYRNLASNPHYYGHNHATNFSTASLSLNLGF